MRKLRLMKYFHCTHEESFEEFIERINSWIAENDVYVVNLDRISTSSILVFYENR